MHLTAVEDAFDAMSSDHIDRDAADKVLLSIEKEKGICS
ncbi:hypothetical protein HBHAL_1257 [Halobacillus halophilus DSM 2266]|uniref:Uncharacterized protein n=1 Tax=Halobacillus halophilus (strain ATCC 35676 / DSM 2266 / JCM 20832 / KCTC 3685 / LMG 17431 / NBRC 102448 / NCIMB 2269) TaxID=866895 RepID=I0JHL6_HALH3|nr:hypothetical protein HBHAL_1257 [Halobacillus halophilus DSM 2266]